jgi:hypothetical protein
MSNLERLAQLMVSSVLFGLGLWLAGLVTGITGERVILVGALSYGFGAWSTGRILWDHKGVS